MQLSQTHVTILIMKTNSLKKTGQIKQQKTMQTRKKTTCKGKSEIKHVWDFPWEGEGNILEDSLNEEFHLIFTTNVSLE